MADFWQGDIPTFQRLTSGQGGALAAALEPGQGARRVTLLLPCHARELGTEAFAGILSALRQTTWLHRIVIGLDQAGAAEDAWLREKVSGLAEVLWLDGPAWQRRVRELAMELPRVGKGRNVWLSLGYILENLQPEVIALHDCDILPYDPGMLARLVYPVARPEFAMEFSKGYYARFSGCLHGRMTRLLFQPLVQALRERFPQEACWQFLHAFRYPLAGEVAMTAQVAEQLSFAAGWGLETAMLANVRPLLPKDRLCQVDLCERYDHRHQPLESGLREPALEVAQTLLSLVREWPGDFDLVAAYQRHAEAAKAHGQQLAMFNRLEITGADDNAAVALFTAVVGHAVQTHRAPVPLLPSWQGLLSKKPVP